MQNRSSYGGWTVCLSNPELPLPSIFAGFLLIFLGLSSISVTAQTTPLPPLAANTCPLSTGTVQGWFGGNVTLNGSVSPANSISPNPPFANGGNENFCAFYQWSEQMFLWLTSPSTTYGNGNALVLDTPLFYDVQASGNPQKPTYTLIRNNVGTPQLLRLRGPQVGPHGFPILVDGHGNFIVVEPVKPDMKLIVRNSSGQLVRVAHVKRGKNGELLLLDKSGMHIKYASAQKPHGSHQIMMTHCYALAVAAPQNTQNGTTQNPIQTGGGFFNNSFQCGHIDLAAGGGSTPPPTTSTTTVIVDSNGGVVDVPGQAQTNGVLMSQYGSLVYADISVNDVYAYFANGIFKNTILPSQGQLYPNFPTTSADLTAIENSVTPPVSFSDANALALEVKTAWIEVSKLPASGLCSNSNNNYITRLATIPSYAPPPTPTQNNPFPIWSPNGTKTVLMALVGMHIVGSTKGHPEMIWATFEHICNTPNATYGYDIPSLIQPAPPGGQPFPDNQQADGGTHWLFSTNGTNVPPNVNNPNMWAADLSGDITIVNPLPGPNGSFAASNTQRVSPWGSLPTEGVSNTQVISMNENVIRELASGDVRKNYILIGALWFKNGSNANGAVGTTSLANSVMETYIQPSSCFLCHTSSTNPAHTDISHLWPGSGSGNSAAIPIVQP